MAQKWQYLVDETSPDEAIDSKLGHWGMNGWELVAVLPKQVTKDSSVGEPGPRTRWTLFFKQPLP